MLCYSLKGQFRSLAEEEINELQDFANAEGFNANLEMWDLPFFRRKHREQLFKCVSCTFVFNNNNNNKKLATLCTHIQSEIIYRVRSYTE